jgi:hypothetical protein
VGAKSLERARSSIRAVVLVLLIFSVHRKLLEIGSLESWIATATKDKALHSAQLS